MLLYSGAMLDPRVRQLGDSAAMFWLGVISKCSTLHRDVLDDEELHEVLDIRGHKSRPYDPSVIAELRKAELLEPLPNGDTKVLARLDLWAFDDEAQTGFVTPM